MHAHIIIGGSKKSRLDCINNLIAEYHVHEFDCIHLDSDEPSHGISDVKNLISRILCKPQFSEWNIAVIHDAAKMTIEAQNALLKTLEEPPSQSKIILESESVHQLLPTILSRVQIIESPGVTEEIINIKTEIIHDCLFGSQGKKLLAIDAINNLSDDQKKVLISVARTVQHVMTDSLQNQDMTNDTFSDIKRYQQVLQKIPVIFIKSALHLSTKSILDQLFLRK